MTQFQYRNLEYSNTELFRYLGNKFDLVTKDPKKAYRVDMIEQILVDKIAAFIKVAKDNENFEESSAKYKPEFMSLQEKFGKFIGEGNWVSGDKLTYVDFLLYEILSIHRLFDPNIITSSVLKDYIARFEALPGIKTWLESEERKSRGFHVLPAMFAWSGAPN